MCFYWIRKVYEVVDGFEVLEVFVIYEDDGEFVLMLGMDGKWVMIRFVDLVDFWYDMYVNIVMF